MATSSALMSTRLHHFSLLHFILIFSGTFTGYYLAVLQPVIDFSKRKIITHENKAILTLSISVLCLALLADSLNTSILLQYEFAAMLSISYYTQINTNKGSFYGTRSIFLIKNIALALAWAFVTSPFQENLDGSIILFFQRFLLIFALSISIDLRDIQRDQERKINTFPLKYGFAKTKLFASILILLSSALVYLYNRHSPSNHILIASIASGTLGMLGILCLHPHSKNEHYLLIIDVNLLLHGILFFIFA